MKLSLSTKWFLWLSFIVAIFCVAQVLGMAWLEVMEVMHGEDTFNAEIGEITTLIGVSLCIFVLMLGIFRFISMQMIKPIQMISESANRISEGDLDERVKGESSKDEVGMLALTLNRAFDRYHEVVRRLDAFAGNAAHQLRTPLSTIRSIGEVCIQKERSTREYRECIEDMLEVTSELTNIVEKLLMLARMNPARLRKNFESVDVDEIITHSIDVYSLALQEKNIEFSYDGAEHLNIKGDESLISQAISNILDNAVNFTPEGGKISVLLRGEEKNAVLQICDSGVGMPQNVSDVFIREPENLLLGGELPTGRLGLAIVYEIMRIHDGEINIHQNENGGTCVSLRFAYVT